MTIELVIAAQGSIVIAADSQVTGYASKRIDYEKLVELSPTGKGNVVVAGSGDDGLISKALDRMASNWQGQNIASVNSVAENAEIVVWQLFDKYVRVRPQAPSYLDLSLLVAGRGTDDEESEAYIVGSTGIAARVHKFDAIGSGLFYARYLLQRLYGEDLAVEQAKAVAVYVVEEVKKNDPNCGGETQVHVVGDKGIERLTREEIRDLVAQLEVRDKTYSDIWRAQLLGEKSEEELAEFLRTEVTPEKMASQQATCPQVDSAPKETGSPLASPNSNES